MNLACNHDTSITVHEWGNLALNLCTWHCRRLYWTLTNSGVLTIQITEVQATEIIAAQSALDNQADRV